MKKARWLMSFYAGPADGRQIRAEYCPPKFQMDNDVYVLVHQCEKHSCSYYVLETANLDRVLEGVLFDGVGSDVSPTEAGGSSGSGSDGRGNQSDGGGQ